MSIHSQAGLSPHYSIGDFSVATGETDGIFLDGHFLQICQSLCSDLGCDEVRNILVTYKIIGKYGSEIPKTALFMLSCTQDGPMISSPSEDQWFIHDGMARFDLVPKEEVALSH